MFTVDGLRSGIDGCKRNIKALEQAIEVERTTMKDYRIMLDDLDRAEAKKKEAEANIHIEVEDGLPKRSNGKL